MTRRAVLLLGWPAGHRRPEPGLRLCVSAIDGDVQNARVHDVAPLLSRAPPSGKSESGGRRGWMGWHRIAPPFGGSASVLTPGLCHNCSAAASEIPLQLLAHPPAAAGTPARRRRYTLDHHVR